MKRLTVIVGITLLCLFGGSAYALDPIPQKPGFSGFIRAGVGAMKYRSNLVSGNPLMDVGNEAIRSLTDKPETESVGMGAFNFELAWTFESRTQVTFGSQLEDIARLELGQQLAVKQELPDKSIVSAGFLFSSIPTQVWKDPYVTGVPRKETDRSSKGIRLVYDKIAGTGLEVRYSYRQIDIDDEQSGLALGLSLPQMDLLQRDGDNHRIDLNYAMALHRQHRIIPSLSYFKMDRDGEAMSNSGEDAQLTYIYLAPPMTMVVNGLVGKADYDETNPIFWEKQKDDHLGANIQLVYRNPFGWKPFGHENFSLFVAGGYLLIDSNIDFYDTEALTGLAGALFRF